MVPILQFNYTKNMYEYEACILGFKVEINMKVHELFVIGNSNLLIYYVQGKWDVKNPRIIP